MTFIDELSRLNDKTVRMAGMVDVANPAARTFGVERRIANGHAYARAPAAKHGHAPDQICAPRAEPVSSISGRPRDQPWHKDK